MYKSTNNDKSSKKDQNQPNIGQNPVNFSNFAGSAGIKLRSTQRSVRLGRPSNFSKGLD
jgi:hypothetical protein